MNWYILYAKRWFELRSLRERLFILGLSIAFLYAIFYLFFYRPIENRKIILEGEINEANNKLAGWDLQLQALQKLSTSPLYQQWLNQNQAFRRLQGQYKYLLQTSASKQWQDVIKTILQSQKNVTVVQIKNYPEAPYTLPELQQTTSNIFQQKLLIVAYSNYFDTINYLQNLEKLLPNIHWDSFNYQVVQYPIAKMEMEFSIFYAKTT